MSDEFAPVTLEDIHGNKRRATTVAEKVAAEFDGFAVKAKAAPKGEKAPKAEKAQTPAQKRAATLAAKKAESNAGGVAGNGGEKTPDTVTPKA